MRFAPELAGPADPVRHTPARAPRSFRRTTTIDVSRPEGVPGPLRFDARGRDLLTGTTPDEVTTLGSAAFVVTQDVFGSLGAAEVRDSTLPPAGLLPDALIGASLAGGFRRLLAAEGVHDVDPGGLWHLLLDDLVGARIVSGLAQQYTETLSGGGPMHEGIYANPENLAVFQGDICAGWATDATMLRELDRSGELPVSVGPVAPDLFAGDRCGFHEMAALEPHSVRRLRRLDVGPLQAAGSARLAVHFRDSHMDAQGQERVVHEYTVAGVLETAQDVLRGVRAQAHVLPWVECPAAVASAERIAGVPLSELRDFVRVELRGVSTCTHLNDVLRSVADVGRCADHLSR